MAAFTVFLSHVTVESKLADWLQRHVENDFIGLVKVFSSSDRLSIPLGRPWLDEVLRGLEQSVMHLVLSSPDSIERPWIHFEAGGARVRQLQIAALCHSGLTPAQLPVPLSQGQGIQLGEAEGIRALYHKLAEILGSRVPSVDFDAYAREVQEFEQQYAAHRTADQALGGGAANELIMHEPRVLCVTSQQFLTIGFENQIDLVLKAFPQRLQHDRLYTSADVRELLATEHVDVVHIAAYVCPRSGDVYFSEIDLASGRSTSAERDVISADEMAQLLAISRTHLVVVGSCESLVLAATVLPVANVIATRDMVSPNMMAKWVEVFYGSLVDHRLSDAFNRAVMASGTKMRLYARSEMRIQTAPLGASLAG